MKKKLIAGAAVLLIAAGAVCAVWLSAARRPVPSVLEELDTDSDQVTDWSRVIAYVPLDDRTDNLEDVAYLAEAAGWQIVLPPGDVYCTKLDGQPLNENGTQYGDREALLLWLQDMEAQGCDRYLLSLDQLFSGGLVNSRSVSEPAPLTFQDGTVLTETEAFDRFVLSLAQDPDNRVELFDSIVRLASTVGYQGFGLAEYNALRAYGMVARPALEGEALTLENIFAAYPYGADGATAAEEDMEDFREDLTEEMIRDYLGVRRRKLQLTDHVITALAEAPYDNIHLLLGADDSSNTANIQYNELNYITSRCGQGTSLLVGLDSLARLLVGRIAQADYGSCHPHVFLRYVGGSQGTPSSEYDVHTLSKTVDLHMDFFGVRRTLSETGADLQVLVMTAPADPAKAADYCEELVSCLEANRANHVPTILIEASNNAYGAALEDMLYDRVDLGALLAYAGKYDQANVTGAGFAMGFARYFYLRYCEDKREACDVAQVRQTANSAALTRYIIHTRYPLNLYIQKLGGDYSSMPPNALRDPLIRSRLDKLFAPECALVEENLTGGHVLTSLDPWQEREITGVHIRDYYFPWNRTFELSFTVDVDPLGPPEP